MQLLGGKELNSWEGGAVPVYHTLPQWAISDHGCAPTCTSSASLALSVSHKPHHPSRGQIQKTGGQGQSWGDPRSVFHRIPQYPQRWLERPQLWNSTDF